MLYALKARDLKVPILVNEQTAEQVKAAKVNRVPCITIGKEVIDTFGLNVLTQARLLVNDSEELRQHKSFRCKWGQVHQLVDEQVRHSVACRPLAQRDNPYILPETWAEPEQRGAVQQQTADPAPTNPIASIRRTERAVREGRAVWRALVRMYARHPELVSAAFRADYEACRGLPLDQVPTRPPSTSLDAPGATLATDVPESPPAA